MRSGKLRYQVQIQQRSDTRDEFNQQIPVWDTLETVWADIVGLSGREYIARAGESADATHRITIRSFAGLSPAHRIVFGDRLFDVQYVSDIDQRGIQMQIIAKERVV